MDDLDPMRPWDRKLLSVASEMSTNEGVPIAVVVAIAVAVTVVVLVVMCVCGEPSSPELKQIKPRKGPSSMSLANSAQPVAPVQTEIITLREVPEGTLTVDTRTENGAPANRNSGAHSRSSQISVTSNQTRPPSLRELPELPIIDPNRPLSSVDNGVIAHSINEAEVEDDYDHLGKERKSPRPRANYDHIQIESPNGAVPSVSPTETQTPSGENYYAQVPDRNYETVSEAKRVVIDPYDRMKDDPYTQVKDDPYSKVKDDPYTKVKDDPYTKVKDDPYSKVKDDPYTKVKDDPYSKVDDPYAKVKEEDSEVASDSAIGTYEIDPYTLLDETTEVKVIEVKRRSSNETAAPRMNGDVINFEDLPGAMGPELPEPSDDYAVVNKPRNASVPNEVAPPEELDPYTIPPEPPRAYLNDEATTQPPGGAVGGAPAPRPDNDPEREYTMVTARESLASMTARNALNPYEIVPETENMYATVDGGSGDGVVQMQAPPPAQEPTNRLSQRLSAVSETYAEIEGNYATAAAPVPPSLDSLHMMTKHQEDCRRHLASPEDSGISGTSNDYAVVDKRSSFSPSATRLPEIPNSPVHPPANSLVNGAAEGATSNGLTLDPNYQTVKDCITYIDENDPNYESVDEARAKEQRKRDRRHVYEEVSPTSQVAPPIEAANPVKERVLQNHMYEDIHELKEQHRKSKQRKSGGNDKR